jgi:peptide/nickel transport system ATP-binding protein
MNPALVVDSISVDYRSGRHRLRAVDGVSLTIAAGESLGLVGESGSGKSTTAKAIMQLVGLTDGSIVFDGHRVDASRRHERRAFWSDVQMVFQDPASSLNPRRTAAESIAQPLDAHRCGSAIERRQRVAELLELVGLDPDLHGSRRPHELSGGQCQRVAIARAMALRPKILLCDEPVSALDVSIQAQIINLLRDLRDREGVGLLFVSHDLAVVRSVADHVAVMYRGRIVELAPTANLYHGPRHPYTSLLLDSIPGRERASLHHGASTPPAEVSDVGCAFRARCPASAPECAEAPDLVPVGLGHHVACHRAPRGAPGQLAPR